MYQLTVTVVLYNASATPATYTGIRYYNAGNGAVVNPTFTVAAVGISGWTFRGWSTSNAGNGNISYTALNNTAIASNVTLYGLYQRTLTVSYNANGGSGTTSAQTGTQFYSSVGTYVNPSFTLRANGFSRSGYKFVRWRLNGTSGTAYNAGGSITISANVTMYAEWAVYSPYYIVQGGYTKYPTTNAGIYFYVLSQSDATFSNTYWTTPNGQAPSLSGLRWSGVYAGGTSNVKMAVGYNLAANFPTNGCTTMSITLSSFTNLTSLGIYINGVSVGSFTAAGTKTFTIPSAASSSFYIQWVAAFKSGSKPLGSDASVLVSEIRLY